MSPNRNAVINGCGAGYVKEGALNAPFVLQLNCGDAKALAVTDSRVGVINGCDPALTPVSARGRRRSGSHPVRRELGDLPREPEAGAG